jgi:hypothetical protein
MRYLETLLTVSQRIIDNDPSFFRKKGAGDGNYQINAFMKDLHLEMRRIFGESFTSKFAEQNICGNDNKFRVDFYFPEEETIVEIAGTLHNASREFEKDIIKAILAKQSGKKVKQLMFISKPGAIKRNQEPGPKSIAAWVLHDYGISVVVKEFINKNENQG